MSQTKDSSFLYHYKAFISAAYDGDTVTADIDLGLKIIVKGEKLRLNRINTPEARGTEREAGAGKPRLAARAGCGPQRADRNL